MKYYAFIMLKTLTLSEDKRQKDQSRYFSLPASIVTSGNL